MGSSRNWENKDSWFLVIYTTKNEMQDTYMFSNQHVILEVAACVLRSAVELYGYEHYEMCSYLGIGGEWRLMVQMSFFTYFSTVMLTN
ncbi:hypothetical protein NC652_038843 [Populus alba x Populus x berolinensis]|nr:hypothetical protein NC652_038834 [Populus alba x Populus x berolinensis]KAJ6867770.1 hypothetical protein NC652_038843 [Populus alba x Populus x berolinensis]